MEFVGVVGAAHHWAAGDVDKAKPLGENFVSGKSRGRDELDDGEMFKSRLEILTQG